MSDFQTLLVLMAAIATSARSKAKISIDGIADLLDTGVFILPTSISMPEAKNHTRQVLFALLGFLTMLYLPIWPPPAPSLQLERLQIDPERATCLTAISQPVEKSTRPLQAMRLAFGEIIPTSGGVSEIAGTALSSSTLYVSNLNAAELLNIGKIEIKWVHTMSSHLNFDEPNQQLVLFALPSYCKLNSYSDETVIAR